MGKKTTSSASLTPQLPGFKVQMLGVLRVEGVGGWGIVAAVVCFLCLLAVIVLGGGLVKLGVRLSDAALAASASRAVNVQAAFVQGLVPPTLEGFRAIAVQLRTSERHTLRRSISVIA